MMSQQLQVGIIGLGEVAVLHKVGWAASEHAELAAGADLNVERLALWGRQNGIAELYVDAEELIADPQIDIVDICCPNRYHEPLTVAALAAGKHVLCEQPLASTPEEIRRMIAARNQSGKLLMTGQNGRFEGPSLALKTEIETGALGRVYHARGWHLLRAGVPTATGLVERRHSGGGPTIEIGVQLLDQLLWFMGHPQPVSVTGVARTELAHQEGVFSSWNRAPVPDSFDVEEFAAAFVRFDSGASLILEVSWLLHGEDSRQLWLYGSDGGCHWPSCRIFATNYRTSQQYDRLLKVIDQMPGHTRECVEFSRAIATGEKSPVPAEHSLQVMQILDAVYRSQKSGREVVID